MQKIEITKTQKMGEVTVIESEKYISEIETINAVEQTIVDFILSIDESHFTQDQLDMPNTLGYYSKNQINAVLKSKSKKRIKHITSMGSIIYLLVQKLEVRINQNGFYFIAFLNDLHSGNKTLN